MQKLNWWFIYGHGRSGTTYLVRQLSKCSRKAVSDWGLGAVVNGLAQSVGIDKKRYLTDLRSNILDNAVAGKGNVIDLVVKQAGISSREYQVWTEMFGEPQRKIFCMREPESFISSVVKKFEHVPIENLRASYLRMFSEYEKIGGDIIDYGPKLDINKISEFLTPLPISRDLEPFTYKGTTRPDLTTPQMLEQYHAFKIRFCPGVTKSEQTS